MFNGQYLKIDTVLEGIKNYPFIESLTRREAANGLVSLIQLIGVTLPLLNLYETIEIKDHKGLLPSDIMYINGVRNKGTNCSEGGVPMSYASDLYHSNLHSEAAKKACYGDTIGVDDMEDLYGPKEAGDTKTVGGVGETVLQPWQVEDIPLEIYENSYNINGSSIDTSFLNGFVEIAYEGVKTDESGYPMIPDDAPFVNAFKYFLLKNAVEPEFFRGLVNERVYREINTQYDFYVGSAANSLNMPSMDQMQSMINGLVRLIPRAHNASDGWKSFNKPEYF